MVRARREKRLVIRLEAPLHAALEAVAEYDSRPLASLCRKILADAVGAAPPERERPAEQATR
jgi:hypothetical protein